MMSILFEKLQQLHVWRKAFLPPLRFCCQEDRSRSKTVFIMTDFREHIPKSFLESENDGVPFIFNFSRNISHPLEPGQCLPEPNSNGTGHLLKHGCRNSRVQDDGIFLLLTLERVKDMGGEENPDMISTEKKPRAAILILAASLGIHVTKISLDFLRSGKPVGIRVIRYNYLSFLLVCKPNCQI